MTLMAARRPAAAKSEEAKTESPAEKTDAAISGEESSEDINEEFEDRRPKGISAERLEVSKLLEAPLSRRNVKKRKGGGGRQLDYVEGWWAIAEANRIFGFDRWNRETVLMDKVEERQYTNSNGNQLWEVCFICKVRITVTIDGTATMREGTGYGSGIDPNRGAAFESATKEAETDAMKRAFMTFGNPFGLALYDKTQANVEDDGPSTPPPARNPNATNQPPQTANERAHAGRQAPPPPRRVAETPNPPARREFAKELIAYGLTNRGIKTLLHICKKADVGQIPEETQEKILVALASSDAVAKYNLGQNSKGDTVLPPEKSIDELEKELSKLFDGSGGPLSPEDAK
jgi:DNA recombination protein Rad52